MKKKIKQYQLPAQNESTFLVKTLESNITKSVNDQWPLDTMV